MHQPFVILSILAPFFASGSNAATRELCPSDQGLRQIVAPVKKRIGTAVQASLLNDKTYSKIVEKEFNLVVPEFELKFSQTHPTREGFSFLAADKIVQFATERGIKVRGHTLVWHQQIPKWVTDKKLDSKQLQAILENHVRTVMTHYKQKFPGAIEAWDVVNEAIDGKTKELRKSVWTKIGKDRAEYLRVAFKAAREADPSAKLFYNDYGIEAINAKSNNTYKLLMNLKHGGVPIDGIGIQIHWRDDRPALNFEQLAANIKRFANLGLEVQITEVDYALRHDAKGRVAESQKEEQAQAFREIAKVCVAAPACTALVLWGFTDRYSWIPRVFRGFGSATVLDASYRHKPAYCALREGLVPQKPSPGPED